MNEITKDPRNQQLTVALLVLEGITARLACNLTAQLSAHPTLHLWTAPLAIELLPNSLAAALATQLLAVLPAVLPGRLTVCLLAGFATFSTLRLSLKVDAVKANGVLLNVLVFQVKVCFRSESKTRTNLFHLT